MRGSREVSPRGIFLLHRLISANGSVYDFVSAQSHYFLFTLINLGTILIY